MNNSIWHCCKRNVFRKKKTIYKPGKSKSSWFGFPTGKSAFVRKLQVVEILRDLVREAGWIWAINSLVENRGPYKDFQQKTITVWFLMLTILLSRGWAGWEKEIPVNNEKEK